MKLLDAMNDEDNCGQFRVYNSYGMEVWIVNGMICKLNKDHSDFLYLGLNVGDFDTDDWKVDRR